ncbi:resolvase [Saccharibacillus sp. O23]|uniref:DUF7674 family protein n=1 Tax=Saccharibacillus sp. O23 TaxID=2009338 RepID=UPI000B4E42BC|nr:resolvase [Saccharibacillus sp. O23]OWR31286.1 resolvase [Saccharibacillus sp. O23]
MSKSSEEFLKNMLEFFPSLHEAYKKSILDYGKVLETVVLEDLFIPQIIELLNEEADINLLKRIFEYVEEVLNNDDSHLRNLLSITLLERLGNHKAVLETAQKYMGIQTARLQIEADRALGRI